MSVACTEIATVTALRPGNRAVVTVHRAEACGACAAKGACQALGGQTKDLSMEVDNTLGAVPGDQVSVSLAESAVLQASAVLYLLPALGLVIGALAGRSLAPSLALTVDGSTILGAFGGLALLLGVARLLGRRMGRSNRYIPRLTAITGHVEPQGTT
jgi:sigma-E factor negative regulatory protein RseC